MQEILGKIENLKDLEDAMRNEIPKVFEKSKRNCSIYFTLDDFDISHSRKIGENQYYINLNKFGRNLFTLRHELYHIALGHSDKRFLLKDNSNNFLFSLGINLRYWFYEEPNATLNAIKRDYTK